MTDVLVYRDASAEDLPAIVAIYNSTIAGRMVTADTERVSVADKLDWFAAHNGNARPLWMIETTWGELVGWLSFQSFYGRPAYKGTVEISIYLAEQQRKKGYGRMILRHALHVAPNFGIHSIMAFIFAHNLPSIKLFLEEGFEEWGNFPDIAILDGISRSLLILGKKVGGMGGNNS